MNNIDLLFEQLYRPLCLYALHYLRDIDAAEDVVQECFVQAWEMVNAEGGTRRAEGGMRNAEMGSAKAWLYRTVRNRCIDELRRKHPTLLPVARADYDTISITADGRWIADDGRELADEEAADITLHEAELWTAIDTLPERQREVLLMSKRDGKTYREIAMELGISQKTVEHEMSRALKRLRGKKDQYYYVLLYL